MENAIGFLIQAAILIFSVVIHEVSHGLAAGALGDQTAKYEGRITLNPVKHLDPVGSFLVPFLSYYFGGFLFGWAKPVPYNPYNLRNQKWGPATVSVAGPASNLFVALFFGLQLRLINFYNLDSSFYFSGFAGIAGYVILLNLVLAVFNLVPIPPLDGSKVLFALLPYRHREIQIFMEQYGLFLLLFFIFFLSQAIFPVVSFLFSIITGIRMI